MMMQILASTKVAMPLFSDFCVNRQPRAAYRCNMDTKVGFPKPRNQVLCAKTNGIFYFCQRAYCFRLGTSCYIWHDPVTGSIHQSGGLFSKICSADTFIQEFLTRLSGWLLWTAKTTSHGPGSASFQQPAYGWLHIIWYTCIVALEQFWPT